MLLAGVLLSMLVGLPGSGSAQTTPTVPANDLNNLLALTGYPASFG